MFRQRPGAADGFSSGHTHSPALFVGPQWSPFFIGPIQHSKTPLLPISDPHALQAQAPIDSAIPDTPVPKNGVRKSIIFCVLGYVH